VEVSHLGDVNVVGLVQDLLVLQVLELSKGRVVQVYLAIYLDYRHRGLADVIDMADPLVLDLIDEFPGNAREDRLLPVLVDRVALSLCGDNHQVNVGPVQTELGGMGAIDLDLALRHDPMDHFSDLSDEELFDQVHLLQDVLHAVSEGKHLIMQLVIELRRVALARWVEHFISLNHLDEIVVLAGRKAEIVPLHAAVALLQGGA